MQGTTKQRWLDLCAEAAICDDPERLQEIASYLNQILNEETERLEAGPRPIRVLP
jgi:hypothetical protein